MSVRLAWFAALIFAMSAPGCGGKNRRSAKSTMGRGGRLGKVVSGLRHRSASSSTSRSSSGGPRSTNAGSSRPSRTKDSPPSTHGTGESKYFWGNHYSGDAYLPVPGVFGSYPYPTNTVGSDVYMYVGIMSVVESDGAMSASIRASSGNFGIGLDNTRYLERSVSPLMGTQYLHLDVWSIYGTHRVLKMGKDSDTAAWLKLGIAGQSSNDLHVLGATFGGELAHNLNAALGIVGAARVFAMQDGIRAIELSGGIAVSLLRISYRWLKFNVGPALHGPEVGLALRF